MSLKATEEFYKYVITQVLKEIGEDPQMTNISSDAATYLEKTWRAKLHETGVYMPHNHDFHQKNYYPQHLNIQPAPMGYYGNLPSSSTEVNVGILMQKINHPPPLWIPPQNMPKDTRALTGAIPGDNKQAIKSAPAFLPNDGSNKPTQPESEDQKNNINIKIEAKASTPQVQKEPVNKKAETPASTVKSTAQTNEDEADDEKDEEEEKEERNDDEEDDAGLFEYEEKPKNQMSLKQEEQQLVPAQQDIEPESNDPAERPLDSDDDPDDNEGPEATDILIGFHEKVHRHGTKWKVNLKHCVMNAKGKEYILSQITGDFDFM